MKDKTIELPPLPVHPKTGKPFTHYEASQTQAYARAAIEAYRTQLFENVGALQRYKECGGDDESDPIERLRFYCSLAMSGQDWLDVEPFFDALVADRKRRVEGDGE